MTVVLLANSESRDEFGRINMIFELSDVEETGSLSKDDLVRIITTGSRLVYAFCNEIRYTLYSVDVLTKPITPHKTDTDNPSLTITKTNSVLTARPMHIQ